MTREAFIRKWLANPQKQYDEHCRDEMRDDLDKVIEYAQQQVKNLNIHDINGSLPISELINDLGDTKRRFIIWHDGGEWIISLEGKEMTNCKTLIGWLFGNDR
jgi:hypothetical protein